MLYDGIHSTAHTFPFLRFLVFLDSNFYANLMSHVDEYVNQTLNKLQETGLLDDTLIINTADHGEMGLSHGGMIQKDFQAYEQVGRLSTALIPSILHSSKPPPSLSPLPLHTHTHESRRCVSP